MSKIFAHRGYSGKYPENTMLAFKKAVECGIDGIELDVQLSKDGVVVIIHDETLDRTTDGTGKVMNYTYEELSKLDASFTFKDLGINRIPTLREYFEYVKTLDIITNIELKNGINEYSGIEEKVIDLIREFNLEKKVIISSFNHYSILKVKKIAPEIKCGFLSESWIINAGKYCASYHIECYHPIFNSLTTEIINELKSYEIEINCWTVNKEQEIKSLFKKKVDSIITNYPELANKIKRKFSI